MVKDFQVLLEEIILKVQEQLMVKQVLVHTQVVEAVALLQLADIQIKTVQEIQEVYKLLVDMVDMDINQTTQVQL